MFLEKKAEPSVTFGGANENERFYAIWWELVVLQFFGEVS